MQKGDSKRSREGTAGDPDGCFHAPHVDAGGLTRGYALLRSSIGMACRGSLAKLPTPTAALQLSRCDSRGADFFKRCDWIAGGGGVVKGAVESKGDSSVELGRWRRRVIVAWGRVFLCLEEVASIELDLGEAVRFRTGAFYAPHSRLGGCGIFNSGTTPGSRICESIWRGVWCHMVGQFAVGRHGCFPPWSTAGWRQRTLARAAFAARQCEGVTSSRAQAREFLY